MSVSTLFAGLAGHLVRVGPVLALNGSTGPARRSADLDAVGIDACDRLPGFSSPAPRGVPAGRPVAAGSHRACRASQPHGKQPRPDAGLPAGMGCGPGSRRTRTCLRFVWSIIGAATRSPRAAGRSSRCHSSSVRSCRFRRSATRHDLHQPEPKIYGTGRGAWPPGPGFAGPRARHTDSVRIRSDPRRMRAPGPGRPGGRSSGFWQGGTAVPDNIVLIMRFHPVGGEDVSVVSEDFGGEREALEAIAQALDERRKPGLDPGEI